MYGEDDLLALSGLQHIAYCERQWALIHIEQSWAENADTLRGEFFHERVDTKGYSCARGVRAERRVHLASGKLGIYGVADIVEYGGGGDPSSIVPVEYKVGSPKAESWDRIQLTAQAMCLEDSSSCHIEQGAIFYGKTRRREVVAVSDDLRQQVCRLARRMHELFDRGETPAAQRSPKCSRCSLKDLCMPEVSGVVQEYWDAFGERLEV